MNFLPRRASVFHPLLALFFVPWFLMLCFQVTNFDAVWLNTCAQRVLAGMTLTDGCYDPNPPLSTLVYFPPALIEKIFRLPQVIVLPCYDFFLLFLSFLAVNGILRQLRVLSDEQRQVTMFAYVAANTILTGAWFGERDQMVLLGLFPFALLQYGLTRGQDMPARLKWPVLALGSIAILIKPHYGLVPAAILIHRAVSQRRWTVFGDPDFAALAAASAAYAAITWFFFRDYLTVILPDSWTLYAAPPFIAHSVWPPAAVAGGFIACMLVLLYKGMRSGALGSLPFFLVGIAGLCLVPFVAQNKGFAYHIVPLTGFLFTGMAVPLMRLFGASGGFKTCLLLAVGAFISVPLSLVNPHHNDLIDYPVTQEASLGTPGCSFFLFDNLATVQNVSEYANCTLASRFVFLWWLQPLLRQKVNYRFDMTPDIPEAEADALLQKYGAMVTGDFERWKPGVAIFVQIKTLDGSMFDFPGYFSSINPAFAKLWKDNYVYEKEIVTSIPHYFVGAHLKDRDKDVHYLVYRRRDTL